MNCPFAFYLTHLLPEVLRNLSLICDPAGCLQPDEVSLFTHRWRPCQQPTVGFPSNQSRIFTGWTSLARNRNAGLHGADAAVGSLGSASPKASLPGDPWPQSPQQETTRGTGLVAALGRHTLPTSAFPWCSPLGPEVLTRRPGSGKNYPLVPASF